MESGCWRKQRARQLHKIVSFLSNNQSVITLNENEAIAIIFQLPCFNKERKNISRCWGVSRLKNDFFLATFECFFARSQNLTIFWIVRVVLETVHTMLWGFLSTTWLIIEFVLKNCVYIIYNRRQIENFSAYNPFRICTTLYICYRKYKHYTNTF